MVNANYGKAFTEDETLAVDNSNQFLYLDRGNKKDPAAVVYVQHKTFSVMCTVEGSTTRLVPLACALDTKPNYLIDLINTQSHYKLGTALHQSDRDGSYRLHTRLSNQLAKNDNW